MNEHHSTEEATSLTLSHAPADDDDVAEGIEKESFRAYLRKAHDGPVTLGDEWTEFVNCGCGSRKDVTLTVVSLTDGTAVGPDTEIEYEPAGE